MTLLEHDTEAFSAEHYSVAYFEGHLARYQSSVYGQRVRNVERFMGDVTGRRVLDLGCGVGYFGAMARARGASTVGLDFSEDALVIARAQHRDMPLVRADATRVPLASDAFDVVLLNDIIEHLDADLGRAMLAEAFRVLRPGGHLVIDTDNDEHLMGKRGLRRLNAWLERGTRQKRELAEIKKVHTAPTLHIKIYTVPELEALLEDVGFVIDAFDTYPYIAVPVRDALFNLPGVRSLLRALKGDVQIFRARKPS